MKSVYKDKGYWHFDGHKTYKQVKKYIENDNKIVHHSFYPFLHYTMVFNKFNITKPKGERRKNKEREIFYCSHIDRYIYQKYGQEISEAYNNYTKEHNIDMCSIAYRTNNPGKCNIHFAKEVFKFLRVQDSAFIIVGDFHKFFDELDHEYLYSMIKKCLNVEKLTEQQYKIFKNITHFSYINIEDVCKFKGIQQKGILKFKEKLPPTEFRNLKNNYLNKNVNENKKWNSFGIPQGSPISAIYANTYMIEFDENIKNLVENFKGIYRRYSDDFILIIPKICERKDQETIANELFKIVHLTPRLQLEKNKTSCYFYKNNTLTCVENLLDGQKNESKVLNFLGFSFDGKSIRLRDKTITKYYYKMYSSIDRHLHLESRKGSKIDRHKLIKKKSKFGSKGKVLKQRNFITYVNKSIKQFPQEETLKIVKKRNLEKLSSRFNLNKK